MGLTRWVRSTSEHYLMIDAQDKVARRLGTTRPNPPRGIEIFWRRIYVPLFFLIPEGIRHAIIAKMPGSHQKQWKPQPPSQGPAVAGTGEMTGSPYRNHEPRPHDPEAPERPNPRSAHVQPDSIR